MAKRALTNAERQARFRERRAALDKSADFVLLREAIHTINAE
ncbi:hypothetical protein [Bradyrhizobium quebecense]|nr:hypothetical protein [Bradyrhizobium quebecense]